MHHDATLGSKSLFPTLQHTIYLAHSAIAPLATPVQQRMKNTIDTYGQQGMGCVMQFVEDREKLREKLATLLHAHVDEIALTKNTSEGIIAIAQSLNWDSGDQIILFNGEFPSNITPWLQVAHEQDLKTTLLSKPTNKERVLHETENALKKGARLLSLSAVQFQTGFRMPLAEIGSLCRQYNCLFFVDAIQACGATPINVKTQKIDFLSTGGHKWLMGVEGTACTYIRQERIPLLKKRLVSWLSHQDGLSFLFEGSGLLRYDRPIKTNASMLEGGVTNAIGFSGLDSALNILLSIGIENIYQHIQDYINPLEEQLKAIGFESLRVQDAQSSILSLLPPKGKRVMELVPQYSQRGICLTGPDGVLRIAPHWCNNIDEQDNFLTATKEILSR
jgi:cysteine desulfurase/selenocysteine lyase